MLLPIPLNSEKIQKCNVPHLKAENLKVTVHFMHFLHKITMRAAMDQNVCIIIFVTVSSSKHCPKIVISAQSLFIFFFTVLPFTLICLS